MRIHSPKTYYRLFKKGLLGEQTFMEPHVAKQMRRIHGRYFVDVGSNKGNYPLLLRKNFWKIYAIEPNPSFQKQLKENTRGMNVSILPFAISEKNGMTKLFFDGTPGKCDGSADTILPVFDYKPASLPNMEKKTFQGKDGIMVETHTLDELFKEPLDLVKVDVEGAEFLVLQGASRLLKDGRIRRIIVELHNRDRKRELEQYFLGYELRWLDPDHLYAEKR